MWRFIPNMNKNERKEMCCEVWLQRKQDGNLTDVIGYTGEKLTV